MKTSCECCAKGAGCPLRYDEEWRTQCPILNADNEPLRYRNSEGYSDPTAFFALRNVMKPVRLKQKPKAEKRHHPRTQVMQPLVDAWRAANPNIVAFWSALDRAARTVIRKKNSARVGKVALYWQDDKMFMQ